MTITSIKLTPLRQDILDILHNSHEPLGAYEILHRLKANKRPTAEPPTVYRVLEYLVNVNLVHRIETENTYISCSHINNEKNEHACILFICKTCKQTFELEAANIFDALMTFAKQNQFIPENRIIEIKGTCHTCSAQCNDHLLA